MTRIEFKAVILGAVILGALAGCGTNQVSYGSQCMTCFDNPMTGKPLNYDPAVHSNKVVGTSAGLDPAMQSTSVPQTLARDNVTLSFSRDVDTTAMRLKDAFGYMTRDEAVAKMGDAGVTMFNSPAYAYSATPGSMYFMKKASPTGEISTTVSKLGNGSRVVITFEKKRSGGSDIQTAMRQIQAKAEAALQ